MTKRFKLLSLVLACVLIFGTATTTFAAENPVNSTANNSTVVSENSDEKNTLNGDVQTVTITANGEASDIISLDDIKASPRAQGNTTYFMLGDTGSISNCGFTPKFRFRASGNPAAQVTFHITTAGGVNYSQGPMQADGLHYIDKQYVVAQSGGTWTFTASVTSGVNNGEIVCWVEQIY